MATAAQSRKGSLLPGFAGIALADILANSVAMIIILIVLTMMIEHEQEEARISEVEDISVLLSRDLATSVVMNGLPTSQPARLHDYVNSPMDANPHPSIMPIIELHSNYIQDYYTKQRFSRDELLQPDNAFDEFLAKMNPIQRSYIRIDIYDIRTFYLTMSIIGDYGPMPRHWHFIGYDGNAVEDDNKSEPGPGEAIAASDETSENASEQPGNSEQFRENENEGGGGNNENIWEDMPADISLGAVTSDENYPFDDLAYDAENADSQSEEYSGEGSDEPADEMFDALSKMMAESLGRGNQSSDFPSVMRFRTATPSSAKSSSEKEQEYVYLNMSEGDESGEELEYVNILAALFQFMEKAQRAVDEGNYLMLQNFKFADDILLPAAMMPALSDEELNFYEYLKSVMFPTSGADKNPLYVEQQTEDNDVTALAVHPNQLLENALLLNNPQQMPFPELPGDAVVRMHVGLYPAIYKGLKINLDKDGIILLPRKQADPDQYRWRIATIVSPQRDDYLLAFVYAAINRDGSLRFAADQNSVTVAQTQVMTHYPSVPYRKENEALLFYGFAALLLLFGVLRRFIGNTA